MKKNNIKPINGKILNMLILMVVLFLIFTMIFFLIACNLVNKNRKEIRLAAVEKTAKTVEQMDLDIQYIYEQSYKFLDNEYTKQYLPFEEENENSYNSRLLIESLSYFRNSLPEGVADIILYSGNNRLYTHEGVYSMEEYFDVLFIHDYGNHSKWMDFLDNKAGFKTFGIDFVTTKYRSSKREPIIPFVIKKNINNEPWVLIVQFKAGQIFKKFNEENRIDGNSFFILDEFKNSVTNIESTDFLDDVENILLENINKRAIYIDENFSINGNEHYLVGKKGLENIYYFYLLPNRNIYIASLKNNFMIFLLFLFSIIAYFIIIISFFRKVYNPIKVFLNFISSMEINKNKNQNLITGVEKIEKDFHKKTLMLLESINAELELLIMDGNRFTFRALQKRFFNLLDFEEIGVFVIYININFFKKYYDDFSNVQQEKIESSIKSIFDDFTATSNGHILNLSMGGFIIIIDEHEVNDIKKIINDFAKIFSFDRSYCEILAGISLKKQGYDALYESVYEAITAGNSVKISSSGFEIKKYAEDNTSFTLLFSSTERNIVLNYMYENNRENLSGIIKKIFIQNQKSNLYFGIYINLYSIFRNIGLEFLSSLQIDLANAKIYLTDSVDFQNTHSVAWIKKYLFECIKYSNEFKQLHTDVEYILEYIKDNYNEDLYLDYLAEVFEINPKYLSQKFKEKTGIHITEYIRVVRITKAKELLIETDLNIVKIGELVGLGNRSTFYRIFINQEGISPSKFRNINKKIGGANEI